MTCRPTGEEPVLDAEMGRFAQGGVWDADDMSVIDDVLSTRTTARYPSTAAFLDEPRISAGLVRNALPGTRR